MDRVSRKSQWEAFKRDLATCLDSLVSDRSASVRFIPMRIKDPGDDDRAVAREVAEMMSSRSSVEIFDREVSSSEMVRLVAESDLVVGMRLHSVIIAASVGIPLIAVNYDSKVRNFMESVGAGEWVYEFGTSGSAWLKSASEGALSGAYPRASVLEETKRLQSLARLNTEIAVRLLHDDSFERRKLRRTARAAAILASRFLRRERSPLGG